MFIFNVQYDASDDDSKVMQDGFSFVLLGLSFALLFVGRFLNILIMTLIGYLIVGK